MLDDIIGRNIKLIQFFNKTQLKRKETPKKASVCARVAIVNSGDDKRILITRDSRA